MSHEGYQLAQMILECFNQESTQKEDGEYYARTSSVSRCPRDMAMHRYSEPWSDPPQAMWGSQLRFDLGYDCEDRIINVLKNTGIDVQCEQMEVEAETRDGNKVLGHMDGIVVIPHGDPLGGKWYVMDVKSAGPYMYRRVYDQYESKPKFEHMKQIAVYSESRIVDKNYPELKGIKVSELNVDGYEFGGGLVVYVSIDRPTKGYGDKKVDFPKLHICQFDIDQEDVELYLDVFDTVEEHYENNTMPDFPHPKSEVVWGGIRCSPRWCNRYSVCKGLVDPQNLKLKEVLHG
jgi:hypothetical protein